MTEDKEIKKEPPREHELITILKQLQSQSNLNSKCKSQVTLCIGKFEEFMQFMMDVQGNKIPMSEILVLFQAHRNKTRTWMRSLMKQKTTNKPHLKIFLELQEAHKRFEAEFNIPQPKSRVKTKTK